MILEPLLLTNASIHYLTCFHVRSYLNPDNKPHAGKYVKFEMTSFEQISKVLLQKSLGSVTS